MRTGFSVPKDSVLLLLDSASMTEGNYDILDIMEEKGFIDKLGNGAINTFIFYERGGQLRVALSDLSYETYRRRTESDSPYIRL